MRDCLSEKDISRLMRGGADGKFIEDALRHVDACPVCREAVTRSPEFDRAAESLRGRIASASECLDYERLASYLDGTLVDTERPAVERHLAECPSCEADLRHLRDAESYASLREHKALKPIKPRRRGWTFGRTLSLGAAAGAVALICVMIPRPPANDQRSAVALEPDRPSAVAEVPVAEPQEIEIPEKPRPAPPKPAVGMKDGAYVVAASGEITRDTAAVDLPSEIRTAIKRKLRSGRASEQKPVMIAMLPSDMLRSGDDTTGLEPESLLPNGTSVLGSRPTLSWNAPERVTEFVVAVHKTDGEKVWESAASGRKCMVGTALDPGETYLWRVGSRIGDEVIYSKAVPFRVLSGGEASQVRKVIAEHPGSHFVKGVTYERYGLYDEALAEFKALEKQNPSSADVRRLVEGLRKEIQEVRR